MPNFWPEIKVSRNWAILAANLEYKLLIGVIFLDGKTEFNLPPVRRWKDWKCKQDEYKKPNSRNSHIG